MTMRVRDTTASQVTMARRLIPGLKAAKPLVVSTRATIKIYPDMHAKVNVIRGKSTSVFLVGGEVLVEMVYRVGRVDGWEDNNRKKEKKTGGCL